MPRRWPSDPARGFDKVHVINPHLSEEVEQLLQSGCFFCHRLRCPEFDVQRYLQALRLVDAGLIGEGLRFLSAVSNAKGQEARSRHRRDANEEIVSTVAMMVEYVDRVLASHGTTTATSTNRNDNSKKKSGGAAGNGDGLDESSSQHEEVDEEDRAGMKKKPATDIRNEICKQAMSEFREFSNVCCHCQGIAPRITTKNGHLFFFFQKKNAEFNVARGLLTERQLQEWELANERHRRTRTYYATAMVREHIKGLCASEAAILTCLYPHLGEATLRMRFDCPLPPKFLYKVFFLDKLLVPPLPLRLSSGIQVSKGGHISPDDQTRALSDVLGFVEQIEMYFTLKNNSTPERVLVSAAQEIAHEHNLRNLQAKVTEVYTDIMESFAKKEGLFRMHMMGKRVNQACRSVISPDYLVEPNEVLLPRPFARSLTFPEQVSPHSPARLALLKRCVINGPRVYPGATHIEVRLPSGETRFVDLNVGEQTRRQHATKYFAMALSGTLIVHRHILDGDRCIFNRQPTLHKVSMMGYRAKVLSGLKTLRFHYVNGKSYNADFDGDEMNIHVPQSIEARAELECLMDANMNYLSPTAGKPIRGLIQDHVVAGVLLTLRDKFLDRDTFTQLVYNGVSPYMAHHQSSSLSTYTTLTELVPVPAILKPRPLWTGKQLISVLVRYVTGVVSCEKRRQGRASLAAAAASGGGGGVAVSASALHSIKKNYGVGVKGTSLIQPSAYTTTDSATGELRTLSRSAMDDDRVLFMNSELITGVLCKNQLGDVNLSVAHVIHEIYGPHMVSELFGALGRVLTMSLQREGFSMGMDDMRLVREDRRTMLLRELDNAPLSLPDDEAQVMPVIMNIATQLWKEFVPGRMLVPFPRNQLLAMTMSGAKGSNTNTVQMALGLGQQLFDGRRVKRMNSGKTLPAFFTGERRARSLGYAIGRFASGIRPPEYTIHAMAGRDGLIDTAVKTSRSGHLQRCLIKGLESLVVHWDHSVRDANGSVVQFRYGGDGLDPMKASTLTSWEFAKENTNDLCAKYGVDSGAEGGNNDAGNEGGEGGGRKRERNDEAAEALRRQHKAVLDAEVARDPLPPHMRQGLDTYLLGKASFPLFKKPLQVARWAAKGGAVEKLREKRQESVDYYGEILSEVTAHKRVRAYCDAGEPVGLLAAQAAGEPSTQMTLNTFHSAGSTVTHVTEGIPRLRELLIYASVKKAAVVVPVEKTREVDERVIGRLLKAGVAVQLADCLAATVTMAATHAVDESGGGADDGSRKSYHFHVERGEHNCLVTVALLFSKCKLTVAQQDLCMSPGEHLGSFTSALKAFAKQTVAALDGRQERAGGGNAAAAAAGVIGGAVQDPSQLGDGTGELEELDDDDGNAAAAAAGNDDEDRSTVVGGTPALSAVNKSSRGAKGKKKAVRSGMKRISLNANEEGDAEDGDGEHGGGTDSESTDGEDDDEEGTFAAKVGAAAGSTTSGARNKRKPLDDDDNTNEEEDEEGAGFGGRRDCLFDSYDTFQSITASLRNGKYAVAITPMTAKAAAAAGLAPLPEDLFLVNVSITTPSSVVAVVPDVLARALHRQAFPTWLPQFESVTFTRKAEDTTCGELVFQGASATLREVSAFISLFTVGRGGRAIKTRKARSTDIHDACRSLGIESGYRCLYDELDKLFRRYAVDYHHLTLIADAATHRGRWENFNFTGVISQSASPLFQMTFASSKRFLHTALTRGIGDELTSISAAIMVGERPKVGTACVKVAQDPRVLRDVVERTFA